MPRPACSFKLRLDLSSVRVQADAARLQQVVINLLSNAAKFTAEGGTASVSLTREGDEAVVVVSDSGVGMAPTQLGRIFEPFERGPRTDPNGLGLGLHVVRRIVDMHEGTVQASSAGEGLGSTLVVRLPIGGPKAVQAIDLK